MRALMLVTGILLPLFSMSEEINLTKKDKENLYKYDHVFNRNVQNVREIASIDDPNLRKDGYMGIKANPIAHSCWSNEFKVCNTISRGFSASRALHLKSTPYIQLDMNRQGNIMYFLRSCDTPESLSKFIYGDESLAYELKKLNPGNWEPGKLIYLRSPKSTERYKKYFYQEHVPISKSYTVKEGENLASIASHVYGDARSWKELAFRNNILNPDQLRAGQKLLLEYKE